MNKTNFAFTIDTIEQADQIISESKKYKIKPIIHIKNYLVKGFGSDYILIFQNILIFRFGKSSFKLYVDCGYDHGLSIDLTLKKIDYLKLKANSLILFKIKNITNKNRVLLNPSFNVVDCRNIKNIKLKIYKIYSGNR